MGLGKVRRVKIEDEMRSSYLDYAMSVIVSRALPDVREAVLHAVFALSAAAAALVLTATWEPTASMLLLAAGVAACSLVLAVSGYRTRRACEPGRAVK